MGKAERDGIMQTGGVGNSSQIWINVYMREYTIIYKNVETARKQSDGILSFSGLAKKLYTARGMWYHKK